jgi:leucyl/phenylalanyl-tRNA--protein transferase
LRGCDWTIRADTAFDQVMRACAAPRAHQRGTWITRAMLAAYEQLHELGHAHSVEIYDADDRLAGGIYGVALGHMFFGESMFSAASNGSKVALIALCGALHEWQFPLLDAQVTSPHLQTMGAFEMPRAQFVDRVGRLCAMQHPAGSWRERWPIGTAAELL